MSLSENKTQQKKVVWTLTLLFYMLNILSWILIFWKQPYTEETILLHYNIFFGIDLTGSWRQLLWIPGSGLVIAIVNTMVIVFRNKTEYLYNIIFLLLTAIIQAMILLATVLVILLNS